MVHENFIVRQCVRPAVWPWIRGAVGYDLLFAWLALYSLALFAVALVLGVLYAKTLGKCVGLVEARVERGIRKAGGAVLDGICALH